MYIHIQIKMVKKIILTSIGTVQNMTNTYFWESPAFVQHANHLQLPHFINSVCFQIMISSITPEMKYNQNQSFKMNVYKLTTCNTRKNSNTPVVYHTPLD